MRSDVIRWVTPGVLGTFHSNDWGCPIDETLDRMVRAWEIYLETGKGWTGSRFCPSEPHPAEITYGGPMAYVEHLAASMLANGYNSDIPLSGRRFGPAGLPSIENGNHRAIAAILTGIEVPVRLI